MIKKDRQPLRIVHDQNGSYRKSPQRLTFLGSMNLYLVVAGAFGFPLHIFPKLPTRCGRTSRGILSMSLVLVDFSTVCIPMSIYLLLYNNCSRTQRSSHVERLAVCEIFLLMFVWFKLASLFIITTLIFTPYQAMTALGIYRNIGALACSRCEKKHRENLRNSSLVD